MKFEKLAPSLLYRKIQIAVSSFLASPSRHRRILDLCRDELELHRSSATTPTAKDNANYAIRALDTFAGSLNALPLAGFVLEKPPLYRPSLFEGVKISVQPTALITVNRSRGKPLKGAIVIDLAKGTVPKTDEMRLRLAEEMFHASYLLHEHVASIHNETDYKPSHEHCLIFHTHRGELVHSPENYKRTLDGTRAACRGIAALWDSIEPPLTFDSTRARYRD